MKARLVLAVGALGVVFGDIGTSPLYVIQECFRETPATDSSILGIGSLIFWVLTILVSFKYVSILLSATNHGEGGIFALFSLCQGGGTLNKSWLFAGGALAGAALLYGDGIITPAISVLSAVEGLGQISHGFEKWVVPITCGILAVLFLVQPLGTGRIGRSFGLIMVIWFVVIGALGLVQITKSPEILKCVNPVYAIQFLFSGNTKALVILGGVLLCITGAEALYADVGFFGKNAIRLGWWGLVKPCLLASYFGQLGWMLHHGTTDGASINPLFAIVPEPIGTPFVILATMAAVIASQALISGVFSLTEQGIRLGFLPRLNVVHTSATERGQVYLPKINAILMASCIALVIFFRNSDNLASAYGFSVIVGMTITSVFFFVHAQRNHHWPRWVAGAVVLLWLLVEFSFVAAASTKFFAGAWIPVVITILLFLGMQTWRWGRAALRKTDSTDERISITKILDANRIAPRISGETGVILSGETLKSELAHYFERFGALPEKLVILTVEHSLESRVAEDQRFSIKQEEPGVFSVIIQVGFAEKPDVVAALDWARTGGSEVNPSTTTFFAFRRTLIPHPKDSADRTGTFWRRALFVFLHRQSVPSWKTLSLPPENVVEIGVREFF
ncbi:UNVERIFIED_CONTAM: hypothetical protein GTU68_023735 [Idotea baltica]|nr:hypothetical protein [Idotea baltica]